MIDRNVEPMVREVLGSVVVADSERFEHALKAIPDEWSQGAFDLALSIDQTVMSDLHEGPPSEERIQYLVRGFYEMETWYKLEGLPIEDFLRAISGLPSEPMDANLVGLLSFLVGGWLLASFLNPDTHWFDYLDDILNRLDANT